MGNLCRRKLPRLVGTVCVSIFLISALQNQISTELSNITERHTDNMIPRSSVYSHYDEPIKVLLLTQSWTDPSRMAGLLAQNTEGFIWPEPGFSYQADLYNLTKRRDVELSYMVDDRQLLRCVECLKFSVSDI